MMALPVRVTTGLVVSTTLTVRVAVPVFRLGSVALYVRVYEPGLFTLTLPVVLTVKVPAQVSLAVAPGSVKLE